MLLCLLKNLLEIAVLECPWLLKNFIEMSLFKKHNEKAHGYKIIFLKCPFNKGILWKLFFFIKES